MLALERWGEDRFLPMVMLAQIAVNSVNECYELIKLARANSLSVCDAEGKTDVRQWQRLYRQPITLQAVVCNLLSAPEDVRYPEADREFRGIRQLARCELRGAIEKSLTGQITNREKAVGERLLRRIYRRSHLPLLSRIVAGEEEYPAKPCEWLGNPEFLFFIGVVAPCLLEYQTTPWKLYRAATQGKFEALEKLVRLDPLILSEDRIKSLVYRMQRTNAVGLQILYAAQLKRNSKPVTIHDVKYLLGGWLMRLSQEWQAVLDGQPLIEIIEAQVSSAKRAEALRWVKNAKAQNARRRIKCRLTSPDIQALFDAVYKDSGRGKFDPDFRKQRKSIYRTLDRNAKLWGSLRIGNKKRAA